MEKIEMKKPQVMEAVTFSECKSKTENVAKSDFGVVMEQQYPLQDKPLEDSELDDHKHKC